MAPRVFGQSFQPQTFAGYGTSPLQQLIQIGPQQLQQQWPPSVQAGPFGLGVAQPFAGPATGLVM